jgi:hypothetical protein
MKTLKRNRFKEATGNPLCEKPTPVQWPHRQQRRYPVSKGLGPLAVVCNLPNGDAVEQKPMANPIEEDALNALRILRRESSIVNQLPRR